MRWVEEEMEEKKKIFGEERETNEIQ